MALNFRRWRRKGRCHPASPGAGSSPGCGASWPTTANPAALLVAYGWEAPLIDAVTPIVMFLFPDAAPEEE